MKVAGDTPEKGQAWAQTQLGSFLVFVVDVGMVEIQYVNDHQVIITVRR